MDSLNLRFPFLNPVERQKRLQVENFFRKTAIEDNKKNNPLQLQDLLDKDDEGNRILLVMPGSIGDVFLVTSLFENLHKQYPGDNLYVATKNEYFEVLEGNPYIHKILPYIPQMDNVLWLEGQKENKGLFKIAFLPYLTTQKIHYYTHNNEDKIQFDIKD